MIALRRASLVLAALSVAVHGSTLAAPPTPLQAVVKGERIVWHVVELSFQHDESIDEGDTPNPFYDFRLDVTFTHEATGKRYELPGFFDADGMAADSGVTGGDRWRVRFVPDHAGTWSYSASFRTGAGVAVDDAPGAGDPASFDGAGGSFVVLPADPDAPGLRSKGMLRYDDARYLRFAWTREAFLKGGVDSPENLLGYHEFDGTYDTGGDPNALDSIDGLHRFGPHVEDFAALGGGPTWADGKGRGLLGALSYAASVGVNSVYFLTYNIDGGDGAEVFPWASTSAKLRYDVSKLGQWERVFDHMTERGIVLHLVLQEEENDTVLDWGDFGDQRKLYHRELVARFACNLGLVWNLGEENSNTDEHRKQFATHLRELDPYDHPIAVHTNPSMLNQVYGPLLGFPDVELCSLQVALEEVYDRTLEWSTASAENGRPWVVTCDEQNPAGDGVVPDAVDPDHFEIRRDVLWANLLAGGGGAEFYFGYDWSHDDLDCEDWRTRNNLWEQVTGALGFLRDHVHFAAMRPAAELTDRPEHPCLATDGEAYLVYTPDGTPPVLDLASFDAVLTVEWYNARSGGDPTTGALETVQGPGQVSLGAPPTGGRDWVALVRLAEERDPEVHEHGMQLVVEGESATLLMELRATDPDGPDDVAVAGMFLVAPDGEDQGFFPFESLGGDLFVRRADVSRADLLKGTWSYYAGVLDAKGGFDWAMGSFEL